MLYQYCLMNNHHQNFVIINLTQLSEHLKVQKNTCMKKQMTNEQIFSFLLLLLLLGLPE